MRDSHLAEEILEQPATLQRLLESQGATVERVADIVRNRAPSLIVVAARGTSDHAARYGKYLFGATNGVSVTLATPSLFSIYKSPPHLSNAMVMGISQSGQSPDVVSVVEDGRRQGQRTLAITNDPSSPLAIVAEHTIDLCAGDERSIAATKTYTASLLALAMLSTTLAQDKDRRQALTALHNLVSAVVESASDMVEAAERYRYAGS